MFARFRKNSDIEAYIANSVEQAHLITHSNRQQWRLGEELTWSLDQSHGQILFSFADGSLALAPVQIIGTLNPDEQVFTWGWKHPAVLPALQKNALRVKAFGKRNGAGELSKKNLPCSEQRAWEYTALAMCLSDAKGVYRAKADNGALIFMNFGEVLLTRHTLPPAVPVHELA